MAWMVDPAGNVKVVAKPKKRDQSAPQPTTGVSDYVRNVSNQLRVDLPASQPTTQSAASTSSALKPFEQRMQGWIQQYGGELQDALAASRAATQSVRNATPEVRIPSVPLGIYDPYKDPRFARIMQQLEQAISAPFQPRVEEHPAYQAAQARLQREAEEQAKRAVQTMAARNILRSAMTEQALKDIAGSVVERLQTEVAPQVYQQLLGERQARIQNLMSQLQAALSAAGFGAEEQARAFQQAMDVARLQESIRQANIMRQLQEAGITGYYAGQPTLERQLQEAGLLGTYQGQPTLAARSLEQQKWEALLPWTQGLTPYQRAQIGLQEKEYKLRAAAQDVWDQLKQSAGLKLMQGVPFEQLSEGEKLAVVGYRSLEESEPTIEDDKAWIDEQLLKGATHKEIEAVIDRKLAEGALQTWEANELKKYLWSRKILSAR